VSSSPTQPALKHKKGKTIKKKLSFLIETKEKHE
jgi:hypothetical protein